MAKNKIEGEFDVTGTSSKIFYPHDGPERESDGMQREIDDRPLERLPENSEHGLGLLGKKWLGKAKVVLGRVPVRRRGIANLFFRQQRPGKRIH
ncbi:MAG: hypothetical protein HY954_11810 [Deltaproteobacteria bacterium]|nr:hypothetical protein [Deltaproteobacteria bacterium]